MKIKTCKVRHLRLKDQWVEAILTGLGRCCILGINFSEVNKTTNMASEEKIFDISFDHNGRTYKGWANPSDKLNDNGMPASFHVVLNDISFGHVSHNNGEWTVNEDRPEGLAEKVGKEIEKRLKAKS